MDFIKLGLVDWKKVKTEEQMSKIQALKFQQILSNCNYAVKLRKKLYFTLGGIGGSSIMRATRC